MTAWTDHIREFAKTHNISYACAMTEPNCRASYQATRPQKLTKKEKKESESMGAEEATGEANKVLHKKAEHKKRVVAVKAKLNKKLAEKELKEKYPAFAENKQMGAEDKDIPAPPSRVPTSVPAKETKKKVGRPKKYATEAEAKEAKKIKTIESNKRRAEEKKKGKGLADCVKGLCGGKKSKVGVEPTPNPETTPNPVIPPMPPRVRTPPREIRPRNTAVVAQAPSYTTAVYDPNALPPAPPAPPKSNKVNPISGIGLPRKGKGLLEDLKKRETTGRPTAEEIAKKYNLDPTRLAEVERQLAERNADPLNSPRPTIQGGRKHLRGKGMTGGATSKQKGISAEIRGRLENIPSHDRYAIKMKDQLSNIIHSADLNPQSSNPYKDLTNLYDPKAEKTIQTALELLAPEAVNAILKPHAPKAPAKPRGRPSKKLNPTKVGLPNRPLSGTGLEVCNKAEGDNGLTHIYPLTHNHILQMLHDII